MIDELALIQSMAKFFWWAGTLTILFQCIAGILPRWFFLEQEKWHPLEWIIFITLWLTAWNLW